MCHIAFTLHVFDLTFMSVVDGDKAGKPVTAVQACVPTFWSLKPGTGFEPLQASHHVCGDKKQISFTESH